MRTAGDREQADSQVRMHDPLCFSIRVWKCQMNTKPSWDELQQAGPKMAGVRDGG